MVSQAELVMTEFAGFGGVGAKTGLGARGIEGLTSNFNFSLVGETVAQSLPRDTLKMLQVSQTAEAITPSAAAASAKTNGIA